MTSSNAQYNTAPLPPALNREVSEIIASLTLEEKVYMMSGHGFFEKFFGEDNRTFGKRAYQAGGGNARLGIEPLKFTDGPRGVRLNGKTTCFPVSMARGASWDTDLERRIGEVIGVESRAFGVSVSGAVCINLMRHPAWGRAQETYGEDPYHIGEMGAALCEGIQRHNVMATVKHFAANSIENARFKVNVKLNERVLREVYLPHFKRVIDAGCASVMSAYNKVNGQYCGHNRHLLRDILKSEWGFNGFVHSDWVKGVYGPDAAEAGLDIENPEAIFFGEHLVKAVEAGTVSMAAIDDAVRRILTTQMYFARQPDPRTYTRDDVCCTAHVNLAREAAEKSMVLLKNDGLLPLQRDKVKKLAVIGRLAAMENLGDHGSSRVTPPYAVTLLEGLQRYVGSDVEIIFDDGSDRQRAGQIAQNADAVIAVAGYTFEDEGEFIPGNEAMEGLDSEKSMQSRGGDRSLLSLSADDEDMLHCIAKANPNTMVALMGGSAIIMEAWRQKVAAIMMVWYPGMEGGNAFARLVFGDANPSGKLPFSIPVSPDHLPFFDKDADEIAYGLYHGYTKFERDRVKPAFPFGFGLSYTQFEIGDISLEIGDDGATIGVQVANVGACDGSEIVQLYAGTTNGQVDRPAKLLRGFARVTLAAGAGQMITFTLQKSSLDWYDEDAGIWRYEDVPYTVCVGTCSVTAKDNSVQFAFQTHQRTGGAG